MSSTAIVRLSTGIPGLDEILHGGLIPHRTYLLVGSTGTGKTIFSLQWLLDGLRRGEKGLYITLAEPTGEVARNVAGFGWSLEELEVLDLTPRGDLGEVIGEYHIFPPSEVERVPVWQAIFQAVEAHQPDRVVIDSVTQLRYLSTDEYQFRKHMLNLVAFLNRWGCTSVLTFEPTELERETSVALAVDGVFRLRREVSPGRIVELRSLEVEKLRGSDYMSGLHPLHITSHGIVIFPHRIEHADEVRPQASLLSSGIANLDELLGGGLEVGTTTVISGPTGVGKSSLVMQFLVQAAASGRPGVLYTFDEPVAFFVERSRRLGMPLDDFLENGKLKLVAVNPMELYPDEFLASVRGQVEQEGRLVVAVDSLRGYYLAMEQFGLLTAHLQNLTAYCHRQGVNLLLVNEVEHITGDLMLTELGVSYLADNALLLRYAEVDGQVVRVIGCLKKRLGDFLPELREFRTTGGRLQVIQQLEGLRGVLTGVPERLSSGV